MNKNIQFDNYETVRAISKNGTVLKEGVVIGQTSSHVRIFDTKTSPPFTDTLDFCELFPKKSQEISVVKVPGQRKKIKALS